MSDQKITQFVTERIQKGDTPEAIRQHLVLVGWKEEDVQAALVRGLIQSGVPEPESGVSVGHGKLASTVEVVLNFFSFILLATVAIALGVLYYQIINKYFPDALAMRYGYSLGYSASAIHYSIAALVVAFPLYAAVVFLWFKRFRDDAEKVESKLTKWLTYLVLLIAAITIVGDLITSVFYFLQGELSGRFFLKAATILIIAGTIFGFYFLERKKIQYRQDIPRGVFQLIGWMVAGYVSLGVILGFVAGGSPEMQRNLTLDATRADNLRNLAGCISSYTQTNRRLPESIDELEKQGTQYGYCGNTVSDPESGIPYEYHPVTQPTQVGEVDEASFELCATFFLSSEDGSETEPYGYQLNDKWASHAVGRECDVEVVTIPRLINRIPAIMY
jgi:hypothetical protein